MPLTLKEKFFYSLICNENRVYKHWYTRFLLAGMDLERVRRVVNRIRRTDRPIAHSPDRPLARSPDRPLAHSLRTRRPHDSPFYLPPYLTAEA